MSFGLVGVLLRFGRAAVIGTSFFFSFIFGCCCFFADVVVGSGAGDSKVELALRTGLASPSPYQSSIIVEKPDFLDILDRCRW